MRLILKIHELKKIFLLTEKGPTNKLTLSKQLFLPKRVQQVFLIIIRFLLF